MAQDAQKGDRPRDGSDEEGGRLTRLSAFVFLHTEHAIYAALGVLLAITAVMALVDAAGMTGKAILSVGGASQLLDVVDRLLFLLMLVEILHTVRVSMRSGRLTCEPFLVVAELTGAAAASRIVLAAPIALDEIEARFAETIEDRDAVTFDTASASLRARVSRGPWRP